VNLSKLFFITAAAVVAAGGTIWGAADWAAHVRTLQRDGHGQEARALIQQALRANPRDADALEARAVDLDDHRDPGARAAYLRLVDAVGASSPAGHTALRRVVELDLIDGDRAAAEAHLAVLRRAGESGLALGSAAPPVAAPMGVIRIPGPLKSFLRMAALSPDLAPEELLPALARNIVTGGFQSVTGSDTLEPTEYLKLVVRYLGQARELEQLSGDSKQIRIEACDSAVVGDLLRVLGFRMRGGCGSDLALETVNATRAFLTMDSGFPLADLEEALRTNRPFTLNYAPTEVPVLYGPDYWLPAKEKRSGEFIDAFIASPALGRLYLGLAKLDPETAEAVRKALPVARIRAFAHVFDFFGGMFRLRDGRMEVPGGARAAAGWAELAGVPPERGTQFLERIIMRDDGWLAGYFDALARIDGPTLEYLTEPARLKRFYLALRGRVTSPGPARPVFRATSDLMLLTTRLRMEDGKPHIPGGFEVWRRLFIDHPNAKYDGKLTRSAAGWRDADDLVEALFGISRKAVDNDPLRIFLALSDLDRRRARPLEPATVTRLASEWTRFGSQYALWNESPGMAGSTLLLFLDVAAQQGDIRDSAHRSDSVGTLQALVGIWQVAVRHRLIPPERADSTLVALLTPFNRSLDAPALFDAARAGVATLLTAAGAGADANPQERLMELLAGALKPADLETQQAVLAEMQRGFDAQKLVSLKSLFDLAAMLESGKPDAAKLSRLAARVSDMNLPKASLSGPERSMLSYGYWAERHIDAQRKLNLRAAVERAGGQAARLAEVRGLLAPLLRDSLVGLLYIHYTPPGAEVLYTNPLFVRSHDFLGVSNAQRTWKSTEVQGAGWPSSAGGRLVGSLATLPYALAEAEQNFLIPTREQALIWGDLVPQLLVSARLPRFWNTRPEQTRYVALSLRSGEALLAEAALDPAVRARLAAALDRHLSPGRVQRVGDLLSAGLVRQALDQVTPAELFELASAVPSATTGVSARRREMEAAAPELCRRATLSELFGTPKPALANSQHPELLGLRTFPTLMGYSSRILAESWESNNLFFAALADELDERPARLNVLLPAWTQQTVERIFATHLEDWPALLRSMRSVADSVRAQSRRQRSQEEKASLDN
jgi:hypothetical protein